MDLGDRLGKDLPIPSRRSFGGGVGGRQPIPHPPLADPNSGRGTPTRDEDSPPPQEDSKDRPEQTPPPLRSTSSHSRAAPAPFPASSSALNTPPCHTGIPAKLGKEPQIVCVPNNLIHLYRQYEQSQHESNLLSENSQHAAFGRQSTFTQHDPYGQQDPHSQQGVEDQQDFYQLEVQSQYMVPSEKKPSEIKLQRSKSPSTVRSAPRTSQKLHTKPQPKTTTSGTSTTTGRPDWKIASRSACKAPGIYPEPFTPLPPVPKCSPATSSYRNHHSETQMTRHEYQMSEKPSQISARQSQISAKPSLSNAKTSQDSVKQGRASAKHTQFSNRQRNHTTSTDLYPPNSTRRSSQVPDIDTIIPVPRNENEATSVFYSSTRLNRSDDAGYFSPERSSDNVRLRGEDDALEGAPVRRSSERVNVERATDTAKVDTQTRQTLTGPIHFEDGNIRFEAKNVLCTLGQGSPNQRGTERTREDCTNLLQKLTAELALSGGQPQMDKLCVRLSLGEQITSDGQRKSFTICEPGYRTSVEQVQEDGQEIFATPSASSPRVSLQQEIVKIKEPVQDIIPEDASDQEVEGAPQEPDLPTKEVVSPLSSIEEDLPPQEEVHYLTPSIEEILPPPAQLILPSPFEQTWPPATEPTLKSMPALSDGDDRTMAPEPTAKPDERPRQEPQPQVHLDRKSSTGIKMKPVENEALNTEFLYYSSALKNLLPVLSCPEDRCRLVPWVKKLFSPEYCARILRDKRNRFLLHLALVLCNDEVIGVFRQPPPEGTIPSVDELCSNRYPPAAWECDSAWLDHLEDIPPGVARMPCPWHPSGCPTPVDQRITSTTDSKDNHTCPRICYPWEQHGANNEISFGWSLDQEFKLLLYLSRPLKPLMKVSKDRQRMVAWLRFLCTVTPDCCIALRSLRNDYIKLLLAYGQDDRMTGPFASDPVWGQPLPPLGDEGDQEQARPFADPASGDVDEFLRTVPVPNEGAFCYVAVDGVPVTPVTRPTASASLLQR